METFSPSPQQARADGPFRLLFVGKPTRLKGGDLLAPLMRRMGSNFELRIAARPQDCRGIGLAANMILLGRLTQQEMLQAYLECDALLLPSRAEGFGYAALEAMACGKPVIASNNTALPEVVAEGLTGILCDTSDIGGFADACRSLANGLDLCGSMGSAGRQRATEHFSIATALPRYVSLIERLT
jgi:glycosyltransferase involved in cell wall biosynthesis